MGKLHDENERKRRHRKVVSSLDRKKTADRNRLLLIILVGILWIFCIWLQSQ